MKRVLLTFLGGITKIVSIGPEEWDTILAMARRDNFSMDELVFSSDSYIIHGKYLISIEVIE